MNEFLPVWPFLKGAVDEMPLDRRVRVRDEVMKGSSAVVLRKIVKHFSLSNVHYHMNTNPAKPVLLISEHVDMDQTVLLEKSAERKLAELNFLRQLKTDILVKMKEDGPHIRLRHQNVPEPDGKIGSL